MALNVRKSRPISVNNVDYRYIISKGPETKEDGVYTINVTIERLDDTCPYLTIAGLTTRDYWLDMSDGMANQPEYILIKPSDIRSWILSAENEGWLQQKGKKAFNLEIEDD